MSWQYEFDTLIQGNRMLQDTGIYLIHTLKPLSYQGSCKTCVLHTATISNAGIVINFA